MCHELGVMYMYINTSGIFRDMHIHTLGLHTNWGIMYMYTSGNITNSIFICLAKFDELGIMYRYMYIHTLGIFTNWALCICICIYILWESSRTGHYV